MDLNDRQLGAVLAGLRLLQAHAMDGYENPHILDVFTNGESFEPLSPDEIDDLCDALNVEPVRHRVEVVQLQPTGQMKVLAFYPVDVSTLDNARAAARFERDRRINAGAQHVTVREVSAPK